MQKVIFLFVFIFSLNLNLLSQSAEDLFQDAINGGRIGGKYDTKAQINILEKCVSMDNDFIEAHYFLGDFYGNHFSVLKNNKKAREHFDKCVDLISAGKKFRGVKTPLNFELDERYILFKVAYFYQYPLDLKTDAIYYYEFAKKYKYSKPDSFSTVDYSDKVIDRQIGDCYVIVALKEAEYNDYHSAIYNYIKAKEFFDSAQSDLKVKECNESINILNIFQLYPDWGIFRETLLFYGAYLRSRDDFIFLYDKKSLTNISKNIVRLWIMSISIKDKSSYSYSTKYEDKAFVEFDLKNKKSKLLKYISYDKSNNILENYQPDNSKWEYIAPETIYESIVENLIRIIKEKK